MPLHVRGHSAQRTRAAAGHSTQEVFTTEKEDLQQADLLEDRYFQMSIPADMPLRVRGHSEHGAVHRTQEVLYYIEGGRATG